MQTNQSVALQALADPTRQQIVARLRNGPLPVGRIADGLPVSRPAVSIHLRVLSDAGLVFFHSQGTRNFYSLRPDGVASLRAWLDELWTDALAAFAEFAEQSKEANDQ